MKEAPSRISSRRRSGGFNLLELMVAITVLAIGIGIAVPSFTDMIRTNRLTTQTNGLMSALALARSEAVKRGTPVTICPAEGLTGGAADLCSDESNWAEFGWIVFSDVRGPVGERNAQAGQPANSNDPILQRIPPASDQKIRIANNRTSLTYRADGMVELPAGATATFVLSPETCRNPEGARQVDVVAVGRVSFRKVNCP